MINNLSKYDKQCIQAVIFTYRTDSVVNQESSIAVAENDCSWFGWLSWRPTSDRLLEMAEKQMLRCKLPLSTLVSLMYH